MEAEYTITEKEYVQANNLYSRLTKKRKIVYLFVTFILIIIAYVAGDSALRGGAIGALIGGIGGYVLSRFVFSPYRTKRLYRSYAAIKEPCILKLQDEGIRFKSRSGEVLIEWSHILKWRDNEEFVLVYQAGHLYHLVPKRLGKIAEQLIERLCQNVGDKS